MKRYIATFFRGRWLYLAVLALMLAATAAGTYYLSQSRYEATARVWVDKPALQSILDSSPTYALAQPPAQQQAAKLYQLLQTDSFVGGIIRKSPASAPLTGSPDQDREIIDRVRAKILVSVIGNNTLMISSSGSDPALCQQLVQGTIEQYITWDLEAQVEQNAIETQFYQRQLKIYEDQMVDYAKRIEALERDNPRPESGSPQFLELQQLQRAQASTREAYTATKTKIDQAGLVETLSEKSRRTEFQILDKPTVPELPSSGLLKLIKYLGLGVVASCGLFLTAIVLATWQDTTVRTGDDLRRLGDVPVLEVIPTLPKEGKGRRGKGKGGDAALAAPATPPARPLIRRATATD
jgi:hypothetical protein